MECESRTSFAFNTSEISIHSCSSANSLDALVSSSVGGGEERDKNYRTSLMDCRSSLWRTCEAVKELISNALLVIAGDATAAVLRLSPVIGLSTLHRIFVVLTADISCGPKYR